MSTAIEKARKIDEISKGAVALFEQAGSFEAELQVANAMREMHAALTDEVMEPVMKLMNTDLGFRTDRDPAVTPKDKDNNPMTPYPVAVVRGVFIEAKLRGFHSIGNEFNIIAGRFYACRNGLKRKCEKWPGVTDLKINLGVPKMVGDKGAIVPVSATWLKDRVADKLEAEIPVRVNLGMGADAILGKAERKIYKRIHDRLSGISTPDGEAGEDIEIQTASASKPAPSFAAPKAETPSAPKTPQGEQPQSSAATSAASSSPSPQSGSQGVSSSAGAATDKTEKPLPGVRLSTVEKTPQQNLASVVTEAGFTFDDFVKWGRGSGQLSPEVCDSITSFDDLNADRATSFVNAKAGLLRQLKTAKGAK